MPRDQIPIASRLLLLMGRRANGDREVTLSNDKIAGFLGVSPSVIPNAVRSLIEQEYIVLAERSHQKGSLYRITDAGMERYDTLSASDIVPIDIQLERLANLKIGGLLTDEEFAAAKRKVLGL